MRVFTIRAEGFPAPNTEREGRTKTSPRTKFRGRCPFSVSHMRVCAPQRRGGTERSRELWGAGTPGRGGGRASSGSRMTAVGQAHRHQPPAGHETGRRRGMRAPRASRRVRQAEALRPTRGWSADLPQFTKSVGPRRLGTRVGGRTETLFSFVIMIIVFHV